MSCPALASEAGGQSAFPRRLLGALVFALCIHAWLLFGLERSQVASVEAETEGRPGMEISLSFAPPAPASAALVPPVSEALPETAPEDLPEPEPLLASEPRPAPRPAPVHSASAAAAESAASLTTTETDFAAQAEQTTDSHAVRVEAASPRAHDNAKPVYPELARRRGQEGTVLLAVSVDAAGRPLSVAVAQSSGHQLLDDAARRAVEKWAFNPARQGGVAVPGQVRVPVDFRLTE